MRLKYTVRTAQESDVIYADLISYYIDQASKDPLTGICKRSPELIMQKILEGNAIIAVTGHNKWVGFCYLQNWNDDFLSFCALIVSPKFRKGNVAQQIKEKALELAQQKYPSATCFGLTTSAAVMKINSRLGFRPVSYSAITSDQNYWAACKGCSNYAILQQKGGRNCLCTAMLLDK